IAGSKAQPRITAQLIKAKADVFAKGANHITAFHTAAMSCVECMRLLYDAGASPLCHDEHGTTPLGYAMGNRHLAGVQFLYLVGLTIPNKRLGSEKFFLEETSSEIKRFIESQNSPTTNTERVSNYYSNNAASDLGLKLISG